MAETITPTDKALWRDYGYEHIQRYQFALPFCDGKNVLDYGCGIGFGSEILANNGAKTVTGFDIDQNVINLAKARCECSNITFLAGAVPPHERFDAVTIFEVIEHVREQEQTIDFIAERLRPGGYLILSVPNRLMFTDNPNPIPNEFHERELTYQEAKQLLQRRFRVIREFEQTAMSYIPNQRLWGTLVNSLILRLEQKLAKRLLQRGRDWLEPDGLLYRTQVAPLIQERREQCHQLLFVGVLDS
jgi:SAM-dependent methyltransferase